MGNSAGQDKVFDRSATKNCFRHDGCYHHLTASKCHPVFTVPPIPCLSSTLIVLLLSDDVDMAYTPPKPAEGTRHKTLRPPEPERPGREQTQGDASPSASSSIISKMTGKRKCPETDDGRSSLSATLTGVPSIFDQRCRYPPRAPSRHIPFHTE